jgi:hypothetical protein
MLRVYGPPLARFYPGLPDLDSLSPVDIAAYWLWMDDALSNQGGDSG